MEAIRILDRLLKKVLLLRSYSCIMELSSFDNGTRRQKQRYFYRSPGDIRIEQLGPFRKGAVVVIRSNGKIKAHAGGLLSFLVLELDKKSNQLRGVTGDSAVGSDWASIIRDIKDLKPYLSGCSIKSWRKGQAAGYEMIMKVKNQPYEPYDGYRFVLREDGPVLAVERFKRGRLMSRIDWKDVQLNPGLPDSLFEL